MKKVSGVPLSCCQDRDGIDDEAAEKACAADPASVEDQSLLVGCYKKIEDYVEDNSEKIMAVAVVAVVVMVRSTQPVLPDLLKQVSYDATVWQHWP